MHPIEIHIENTSDKTRLVSISDILENVQRDKDIHYAFRKGDQKMLDKMRWTRIRLFAGRSFWDRREEAVCFKNIATGKQHFFTFKSFWREGQFQYDVLDIFHKQVIVSNCVREYEILCPIAPHDSMHVIFIDDPVPDEMLKAPEYSEKAEEEALGEVLKINFKETAHYYPFSVEFRKNGFITWVFPEHPQRTYISMMFPFDFKCSWKKIEPDIWYNIEIRFQKGSSPSFVGSEMIFKHNEFGGYDRQFFEALFNMIFLTFMHNDKSFAFYAKKPHP